MSSLNLDRAKAPITSRPAPRLHPSFMMASLVGSAETTLWMTALIPARPSFHDVGLINDGHAHEIRALLPRNLDCGVSRGYAARRAFETDEDVVDHDEFSRFLDKSIGRASRLVRLSGSDGPGQGRRDCSLQPGSTTLVAGRRECAKTRESRGQNWCQQRRFILNFRGPSCTPIDSFLL